MHDELSLVDIAYPVFVLGNRKPERQGDVLYYVARRTDKDDNDTTTIALIDDKSAPGVSLASRRLHLASQALKLAKIHIAVYFLGDLIKLAKPDRWFIDSKGVPFQYKKRTRAKLEVLPITKIINIPTGGAIIEVKGMLTRFKCLYAPPPDTPYAGVLHIGMSKILFGFYETEQKKSWRLV